MSGINPAFDLKAIDNMIKFVALAPEQATEQLVTLLINSMINAGCVFSKEGLEDIEQFIRKPTYDAQLDICDNLLATLEKTVIYPDLVNRLQACREIIATAQSLNKIINKENSEIWECKEEIDSFFARLNLKTNALGFNKQLNSAMQDFQSEVHDLLASQYVNRTSPALMTKILDTMRIISGLCGIIVSIILLTTPKTTMIKQASYGRNILKGSRKSIIDTEKPVSMLKALHSFAAFVASISCFSIFYADKKSPATFIRDNLTDLLKIAVHDSMATGPIAKRVMLVSESSKNSAEHHIQISSNVKIARDFANLFTKVKHTLEDIAEIAAKHEDEDTLLAINKVNIKFNTLQNKDVVFDGHTLTQLATLINTITNVMTDRKISFEEDALSAAIFSGEINKSEIYGDARKKLAIEVLQPMHSLNSKLEQTPTQFAKNETLLKKAAAANDVGLRNI